ncbi:putative phosphoribosyltransferase [Methanocella conradii HZ254]|uniref:Phosphoribosyltransferase n=1 Tax=Methanocella conradii (strain DSM 24694 / JCM 17849 / CGMCC 1.5162 / HZ254) TaxID=1041930 RepID=H8I8H3_METCZ|nr:phosphoribosyltransferase family protein [Methanocella conradii]AFC99449.1 putative phosphoribosyltransferase [Methanocella conradii HZ254]MDI6898005.1 phosphoribosyltransferase family protein [Methanocella conradii]
MKFKDRAEAGRLLALRLGAFKGKDVIVLAIPMGGIPVAYEIARELKAPLDVIMAKKIGAPFNPELAIGAVTWNGAVLLDEDMMQKWQIPREYVNEVSRKLVKEMSDKLAELRVGLGSFPKLFGRVVIIVDDGIATGNTMIAAVEAVRDQGASEVAIAVPVLPKEMVETMELVAPLYYLEAPEDFEAVGQYYEQFEMVSRETAVELMLLANVA